MELEGFGASLVGRCVYVNTTADYAWVPWEFVNGTYTSKILICGNAGTRSETALSNNWTAVFNPVDARIWSAVATVVKGLGPTVLLVFDVGYPTITPTFLTFLDNVLAEGRTVLTRVFLGTTGLPAIPDAIFFPVGSALGTTGVYDTCMRLPAVRGHGSWTGMAPAEFSALMDTVTSTKVGVAISDVGETGWTLFWHRPDDSRNSAEGKRILPTLLRVAMLIASVSSD